MKLNGLTIFLMTFSLLTIISSCKKDDESENENNNNNQNSSKCFVTNMKYSSNNILQSEDKLEYDTDNKLIKKTYLEYDENGNVSSGNINIHEYNSNGQLIEYVTYDYFDNSIDEKIVFDYNNEGRILKYQTFKRAGSTYEPDSYIIIDEYANELPVRMKYFHENDELYRIEKIFVTNGNIEKLELYKSNTGIENLDEIYEYSFNDKNSPFYLNIGFLNDSYDPIPFFSKNCFTGLIIKDDLGAIQYESSFSYSNYNSHDFPTEMVINGNSIEVEYQCNE
ncbi:MAG: hypothetical protein K8S16_03300 [Bacteroidales bacterium]|nr:hypothetical protein [Bacteroidales bacterium]